MWKINSKRAARGWDSNPRLLRQESCGHTTLSTLSALRYVADNVLREIKIVPTRQKFAGQWSGHGSAMVGNKKGEGMEGVPVPGRRGGRGGAVQLAGGGRGRLDWPGMLRRSNVCETVAMRRRWPARSVGQEHMGTGH